MAKAIDPTAILSHLHRADGSATFSQNGYTVIGSVNGPIEVQRRDELSEEAVVDVIVLPVAGVGGTRERHLESILQATLRQILLIHNYPRTLFQVTLQITNTPENDSAGTKLVQASSNLPVLPALLQTSVLSLLSASMPLAMTVASVVLALSSDSSPRRVIHNPTIYEIETATSVHVLGFTSKGDLLVAESEGHFSTEDWDEVYEVARSVCRDNLSDQKYGDALDTANEQSGGMQRFMKSVLQAKVADDLHWKR